MAVKGKHLEMAQMLIEKGADLNVQDYLVRYVIHDTSTSTTTTPPTMNATTVATLLLPLLLLRLAHATTMSRAT